MRSQIPADVLSREQKYFDVEASELDDRSLTMPREVIDRYCSARHRPHNTAKETLFATLRPLTGKRVLDYGCGTGADACLLASAGATVTAFDLSPISIAKARRRAELAGVANRIQFDVLTAGSTAYPSAGFDIIVGFMILHHLHMYLDGVYDEVDRLLAPGGTVCFIEPVANNSLLKRLRRVAPIALEATSDERQLRYDDLEQLRRHGFTRLEYHHYYCLERLHRILGEPMRRPLRWTDHHLLRLVPSLRSWYGTLLVIADRGDSRPAVAADRAQVYSPLRRHNLVDTRR